MTYYEAKNCRNIATVKKIWNLYLRYGTNTTNFKIAGLNEAQRGLCPMYPRWGHSPHTLFAPKHDLLDPPWLTEIYSMLKIFANTQATAHPLFTAARLMACVVHRANLRLGFPFQFFVFDLNTTVTEHEKVRTIHN